MRPIDAEPIEKFIENGLNCKDPKKRFGHDAIEILTEIHYAPTISPSLPPNPPLTLDELREMALQDWLWVEILIPAAFRRVTSGYFQVFEDYTKGEALCAGWPGTIHEFEHNDYGNTWLAYRRKPEEETTERCAICAVTGVLCSMCQPGPCESRR